MTLTGEGLRFELEDLLEVESESKTSLDDKHRVPHGSGPEAGDSERSDLSDRISAAHHEGPQHYDPAFRWGEREERSCLRKLDRRIFCIVALMFLSYQTTRQIGSLANANYSTDNMPLDMQDHRIGQTVYSAAFICAALPSQLLAQSYGPSVFMPAQLICWSVFASLQSQLSTRWALWLSNGIMGIAQSGFMPALVQYLSCFYTSSELTMRLSWLWALHRAADAIFTLMAYAILHLSDLYEIPGWQCLTAFQSIFGCLLGGIALVYLPPSITQPSALAQTKALRVSEDVWLSESEQKISVNRLLRDDATKGNLGKRTDISLRGLWTSLMDYNLWPLCVLGLSWQLPSIPAEEYLPKVLHALGYGGLDTGLLTVPSSVIWILNLLVFTWVTEFVDERLLIAPVSQVWALPLLIALKQLPENRNTWQTYSVVMVLLGQPYMQATLLGLVSRNAGSSRTRIVGAAVFMMCTEASQIIGRQIYRQEDAPFYYRANTMLIIIAVFNLCLFIGTSLFYSWTNKERDREVEDMPTRKLATVLARTRDAGSERLDFRFAY